MSIKINYDHPEKIPSNIKGFLSDRLASEILKRIHFRASPHRKPDFEIEAEEIRRVIRYSQSSDAISLPEEIMTNGTSYSFNNNLSNNADSYVMYSIRDRDIAVNLNKNSKEGVQVYDLFDFPGIYASIGFYVPNNGVGRVLCNNTNTIVCLEMKIKPPNSEIDCSVLDSDKDFDRLFLL